MKVVRSFRLILKLFFINASNFVDGCLEKKKSLSRIDKNIKSRRSFDTVLKVTRKASWNQTALYVSKLRKQCARNFLRSQIICMEVCVVFSNERQTFVIRSVRATLPENISLCVFVRSRVLTIVAFNCTDRLVRVLSGVGGNRSR